MSLFGSSHCHVYSIPHVQETYHTLLSTSLILTLLLSTHALTPSLRRIANKVTSRYLMSANILPQLLPTFLSQPLLPLYLKHPQPPTSRK